MAYIRFYSPYHSAFRDESANEAYERLVHRFNSDHNCGCKTTGSPSANLSETDKEYRIEMALPGVDKQNISIRHENGLLHISVSSPTEQEGKDQYYLHEFNYAGTSRIFKTGDNIDSENISAKLENGVLSVSLPKKEIANKAAQSIVVS